MMASKDLRAVSAINYQLYAEESIKRLKKVIESLSQEITKKLRKRQDFIDECRSAMRKISKEEMRKINEILTEVDQFVALMCTAGDPAANTLLARKFNELHDAVNPSYPFDFPSPELIIKKASTAIKVFKIAVARSFQNREIISQKIQINAFEAQAIINEPQVRPLPLKKMLEGEDEISLD